MAHQNQKSKKVLTILAFTSTLLLILATACFVVLCLWVFFDFIKERFVVHKIKSLLENEASPEWIKLIRENLIINAEGYDQKSEKGKDIVDSDCMC